MFIFDSFALANLNEVNCFAVLRSESFSPVKNKVVK